MTSVRTILHPTDFSPQSDCAFPLAWSLARDLQAGLLVLHVIEQPLIAHAGVMMAPPPPPVSEAERQALLDKLRGIAPPPGSPVPVERLLEQGDPAAAILQIARERQCDLIVLGTHGRTGLPRLLMGSVAEKVLREATCPVLVVKPPLPAEGSPSTPPSREPLSKDIVDALRTPPT